MATDESDTTQDAASPEPTRTREERIEAALDVITDYAGIDGSHHKQWIIDQVVRALHETADDYSAWVTAHEITYGHEWDVGIAP